MRVVARLVCAVAIERRFAVGGAGWFLPTVLAGVLVHAVARHNRFLFSIWRSCICCAFVCTHICLMPRACLFARSCVFTCRCDCLRVFASAHVATFLCLRAIVFACLVLICCSFYTVCGRQRKGRIVFCNKQFSSCHVSFSRCCPSVSLMQVCC